MRVLLTNRSSLIQWLSSGSRAGPARLGLPTNLVQYFPRRPLSPEELEQLTSGRPLTITRPLLSELGERFSPRQFTRVIPFGDDSFGVLGGKILEYGIRVLLEEPLILQSSDDYRATLDVYRQAERQELRAAIRRRRGKRPSWIVVTGPSGTGKSTLIREVVSRQRPRPDLEVHEEGEVQKSPDPHKIHIVDLPVLRETEIPEAMEKKKLKPDEIIFVPCKPLSAEQRKKADRRGQDLYFDRMGYGGFSGVILFRDPAGGRRLVVNASANPDKDPIVQPLLTERGRHETPLGPPPQEREEYIQAAAWCRRLGNLLGFENEPDLGKLVSKILSCSRDWLATDGYQNARNAVNTLRLTLLLFLAEVPSPLSTPQGIFEELRSFLRDLHRPGRGGPLKRAQDRHESLFPDNEERETYRNGRALLFDNLTTRLLLHTAGEIRKRKLGPAEKRLLDFLLQDP